MTPPRLPTAGPRRVLRPGLHVVRRDDRHLQVGLDAPLRLRRRGRPRRTAAARRPDGRPAAPARRPGHRLLDACSAWAARRRRAARRRARPAAARRRRPPPCSPASPGTGRGAARWPPAPRPGSSWTRPPTPPPSAARLLRAAGVAPSSDRPRSARGRPRCCPSSPAGAPRRVDPLVRAGRRTCCSPAAPRGARGSALRGAGRHGVPALPRRPPRRARPAPGDGAGAVRPRGPPGSPVDPAQLARALAWAVGELVALPRRATGRRPGRRRPRSDGAARRCARVVAAPALRLRLGRAAATG